MDSNYHDRLKTQLANALLGNLWISNLCGVRARYDQQNRYKTGLFDLLNLNNISLVKLEILVDLIFSKSMGNYSWRNGN